MLKQKKLQYFYKNYKTVSFASSVIKISVVIPSRPKFPVKLIC